MTKRLFLIPVLLFIVSIIPLTFAQGESVSSTIPTLRDGVNHMLQQGMVSVEVGALQTNTIFLEAGGWDVFEGEEAYLRVDEGVYELYAPAPGMMWGRSQSVHQDVVLQVQAESISGDENVGYGLMCRASTNDSNYDGYHFWVSADGFASIFKVVDDDVEDLVEFRRAFSVRRGDGINTLTVVCVGDYLAFYVNQQIVAEVHDDSFTQGLAGVSGSSFFESSDIHIRYDDFRVWSVGDASTTEPDRPTSIRNLATDPEVLRPELNRLLEQGSETVVATELVTNETFDADNGDWVLHDLDAGSITIADGVYRITNDGSEEDFSVLSGRNSTSHTDVVIQATTRNLSNNVDSYAGVACRAQDTDIYTGYVFWVGSDGYYTILYWTEDDFEELAPFAYSDAINIGATENEITVVCSGEYLALFVNGELIDEVEDDRLTRGVTALGASYLADDGSFDITFDDVRIWEVEQ
jgi:hypothetical protein